MTGRPRRLALRAFLLGGAVVAAGCGIPTQGRPTQLNDDRIRVGAPTTTATTIPDRRPDTPVELCVASGSRLVTVTQRIRGTVSPRTVLGALTRIAGTDLPDGTRSLVDGPGLVSGGPVERGVALVAAGPALERLAPSDRVLAFAQVVCTLSGLPGIGQVRFTRAGRPIAVPRADGSLTATPVSRFDYRSLLPSG